MSTPALWCEARCHYFCAETRLDGRPGCHETAPGAFGIKNAVSSAKGSGWRVIHEKWCCPACLKKLRAA